uniref:Peptidoglycan binding-like domain-containing protein n=1 Tax=Nymphaea colorata TaxID=210225 RepID=A0A5K1G577_9MAGN
MCVSAKNHRKHAWAEFVQHTGYRVGQTHAILPSLKKYLHHFGYLATVGDTAFSHVFYEDLEAAVRKYQTFFNINATGILDAATVHQMIKPRCGVEDIIKGSERQSCAKAMPSVLRPVSSWRQSGAEGGGRPA